VADVGLYVLLVERFDLTVLNKLLLLLSSRAATECHMQSSWTLDFDLALCEECASLGLRVIVVVQLTCTLAATIMSVNCRILLSY